MRYPAFFPLALTLLLFACNNVLPPQLENRVRERLAADRERDRMLKEVAVVKTEKGEFTIRFFGEETPNSVLHTRRLIQDNFYDNLRVHRAIHEPIPFVVQLGDPVTRGRPGEDFRWEQGDDDKPVAGFQSGTERVSPERSERTKKRGKVMLARQPCCDTFGSQFYILLDRYPYLDDQRDTVIGEIAAGMDVVEQLRVGDRILSIRLVEPPPAD
jgi:peptidyl-prolyl cis-trans isomerase B (cyclophilin B)